MPCRHDTEPETNALYGCDGTCLVEEELEDRDEELCRECGTNLLQRTDGELYCPACEQDYADVELWAEALESVA